MQIILLSGAQGTAKSVLWAPALKRWCETLGLTVTHVEQIGWHHEEYRTLRQAGTDVGIYETHDVEVLLSERPPNVVATADFEGDSYFRLTLTFANTALPVLRESARDFPDVIEKYGQRFILAPRKESDRRYVILARSVRYKGVRQ